VGEAQEKDKKLLLKLAFAERFSLLADVVKIIM